MEIKGNYVATKNIGMFEHEVSSQDSCRPFREDSTGRLLELEDDQQARRKNMFTGRIKWLQ